MDGAYADGHGWVLPLPEWLLPNRKSAFAPLARLRDMPVIVLTSVGNAGKSIAFTQEQQALTAASACLADLKTLAGKPDPVAFAGLGVPEDAPYDRAIVTIGSLDIPPAWFGQLKPGARLVVPLRWCGQTQSVALVLGEDGVFRSDSVFLYGFVPMIGQGWKRSAALDAQELVRLDWDADTMDDPALPDLLRIRGTPSSSRGPTGRPALTRPQAVLRAYPAPHGTRPAPGPPTDDDSSSSP